MIETRHAKRQKRDGIELLNSLLMEFVRQFNNYSIFDKGEVRTAGQVWGELQKLDDVWKRFCNNILHNPKKDIKFKPEALISEAQKHIQAMKKAAWTVHMPEFIKARYGIAVTSKDAGNYYAEDRQPDEAAIEIIYDEMHKIEIPDIGYSRQIPSEMREMTPEQFIFFAGDLLRVYNKEITMNDFKSSMILKFLNVRYSPREYKQLAPEEKVAVADNINRMSRLCDFFFEQGDEGLTVNLSFTRNFVPKLKRRLIGYRGPADGLTDISFLEYKDANHYYQEYLKEKKPEDLHRLIAVLYRPAIFGRKLRYNPARLEKRAARIGRRPEKVKFAIFLFYMACEKFLRSGTFRADGQDINLALLYEVTAKEKKLDEKKKYPDNTGLTGIAFELAEQGIFGNLEAVFRQNLYDVLLLLYKKRVEYLNVLDKIE